MNDRRYGKIKLEYLLLFLFCLLVIAGIAWLILNLSGPDEDKAKIALQPSSPPDEVSKNQPERTVVPPTPISPTPEQSVRIVGLVQSLQGEAIADVTVCLFNNDSEPSQMKESVSAIHTSENGSFEFQIESDEQYRLTAEHTDYRQETRIVNLDDISGDPIVIALCRIWLKTGRVLLDDRTPVPDWPVSLTVQGGNRDVSDRLQTDAQGQFLFAMDERQRFVVSATRELFVPALIEGILTDPDPVLILSPNGQIVGKTVDEENKPVGFASINIQAKGEEGDGLVTYKIEADQNGNFSTENVLPPGTYHVSASLEDYTDMGGGNATVELQNPPNSVTLTLIKNLYTISGRVIDYRTQQGVPDMNVQLLTWTHSVRFDPSDRKATTDENGRFEIERIPAGYYIVSGVGSEKKDNPYFFPTDIKYAILAIKDQSVDDVTLYVAKASRISGVVCETDGKSVPNADVRFTPEFSGNTATTDDRGQFKIIAPPQTLIKKESFRLLASVEIGDSTRYGVSDSIEVAPGDDVSDVVIQIQNGIRLEGRVINQKGEPVAGANLSLLQRFGRIKKTTQSDQNGFYSFDGLIIADIEQLGLYEQTWLFVLRASSDGYGKTIVCIVPPIGEPVVRKDVVMEEQGWIKGRVTDRENRPLSGVQIYANRPGISGENAVSDANGEYEFLNLPIDFYKIRFDYTKHPTLSGVLNDVYARTDRADIVLGFNTRTIHVDLTIDGDFPSEGIDDFLSANLYLEKNGQLFITHCIGLPIALNHSFSIKVSEPGRYVLRIYIPSYPFVDLTVTVDENSDSVIYLEHTIRLASKTCTLTGRVIPLPDYDCIYVEIPWGLTALVREDLTFSLKDVPPGRTQLIFWIRDKSYGLVSNRLVMKNIVVKEGGVQALGDIDLKNLW